MTTLRTRAARASLLALLLIYLLSQNVATAGAPSVRHASGSRANPARTPGPSIEPYVRPAMARQMRQLRPAILAAARRHNLPAFSGMSDQEFAAVIATILYNENFGWLEDGIAPLRPLTPLYQDMQRWANVSSLGGNFSVWPANLRPSVALEIARHELPLADGRVLTVPVRVADSRIDPDAYGSREALYAALTGEISRADLAVEYLAANLERGLYRAAIEGAPVSWRTLAAWHNQGIMSPQAIRDNPTASDYVRRAAAYLPTARALVREYGKVARKDLPPQQPPHLPAVPASTYLRRVQLNALMDDPGQILGDDPGVVVGLDHNRRDIIAGGHTIELNEIDLTGVFGDQLPHGALKIRAARNT